MINNKANNRMKHKASMNLMVFVIAIIVVVFLYLMEGLSIFSWQLYDQVYEQENSVSKEIVIVGIDDASYTSIGRWPFSRRIQGEIFDNILKDNPAVLGIDVIYDAQTDEDDYLVEVLSQGSVVVAETIGDISYGQESVYERSVPFEALADVVDSGYINAEPDDFDGIVRRVILTKSDTAGIYDSFPYEIYTSYQASLNQEAKPRTFDEKYIDFAGGSNSFAVVPAHQVLNGKTMAGFFKDKIVLFGPYTVGMQDDYYTPIDKVGKTYGVEIHANIIQNLMNDSFKVDLPGIYQILLILVSGLLSFFIGNKWGLKVSASLQVGLLLVLLILGKVLYGMGYVTFIVYPMTIVLLVAVANILVDYMVQLTEKRRITGIFGKYVAPQIVEKILEDGEESLKLGGVRTEITVLFVDIRGFTPLSEVAEPEEIVLILNDYLELCARAIFDHNGTLDKFIGDAAMAIYNAPLPLEDHPLHAVKTAWAMKVEGERLAERLFAKYGRDVRFGIGLNTGKAIVGNIGSKVRMDYTAIGDTVNVSARLESVAKPGQILMSEATYEKVKENVIVSPLGSIKVKGKENEIKIYQLDGIK